MGKLGVQKREYLLLKQSSNLALLSLVEEHYEVDFDPVRFSTRTSNSLEVAHAVLESSNG